MKLIILDRDGVINHDSDDFIKSPEEWQAIDGSLEAISRLTHAGFHLAVVSNQSGLGRGLFTIDQLNQIHQKMLNEVYAHGGMIDAIFFCPHAPDENCYCRKPKPGLFDQIAFRLGITLDNVPYIGDKISDMEAAEKVGARPILVKTGSGKSAMKFDGLPANVSVYENLSTAADSLLS